MSYNYHKLDGLFDIESIDDLFTFSHYTPSTNSINVFVLKGEDHIVPLTNIEKQKITRKIRDVNSDLSKDTTINIFNGVDELMYLLIPMFADKISKGNKLFRILSEIKNPYTNRPLTYNPYFNQDGSEMKIFQLGFNSRAYDLAMLAYVIYLWIGQLLPQKESDWDDTSKFVAPKQIKSISNKIINASYPGSLTEFGFTAPAGIILQAMTKSRHFADIRLLLGKSAQLTLGLKRYAAQAGWQILESELVKTQDSLEKIVSSEKFQQENPGITVSDLIADVIAYNVLDVINSMKLFELKDWQTGFSQHQQLLDRFKDSFEGKLYIDSTNTKFIEYVIVPNNGGKPVRLKDSPTIDLTFPTINGPVDILEYAKSQGIPEEVYAFYDNYRGATSVDEGKRKILQDDRLSKALNEKRLSETGTTLDLWMTDTHGRPNKSHGKVSIGGYHGEYADYVAYITAENIYNQMTIDQQKAIEYFNKITADDGLDEKEATKNLRDKRLEFMHQVNDDISLYDLNPIQYPKNKTPLKQIVTVNSKKITEKKIKEISQIPADYVKTIYGENIVHADVDALYPSLLTILQTLRRLDGNDVYGELRNERLQLKKSLPEEKADFSEKDWKINDIQLLNKLLLNSATGGADANFDTNILVSNKITAMRIIGNILIYILSMRLADIGATIVSMNTDGLYTAGVSEHDADVVIDDWKDFFGLSADPEIVDLFISKDTNNRLEIKNNKIDYAGGGSFSAWRKPSLMKSVAKPAIIDEALVKYLAFYDKNPLTEFDTEFVKTYISNKIKNSNTQEEKEHTLLQFQWIFTGSASKNRSYYEYNTETKTYHKLSNISRAFITKPIADDKQTKIKLLSVNKTNAVVDPDALALIDPKELVLTDNLHLITHDELEVDNLISEIKGLKAKDFKDDVSIADWYDENKERCDKAVSVMNIPLSKYAPLALVSDFKTFTTFFKAEYKASMIGTNSNIIRPSFVASPRVDESMSFTVNNHALKDLTSSEILNNVDIDKYVNLVKDEWGLWSDYVSV